MRAVVGKHFEGKLLFDSYIFEMEEGEVIRLAGPSGRGKTTLLRVLCGLEENECRQANDFLHHSFAWVFQEDRLSPTMSAYNNIALALGKSVSKEAILSAFAELSLDEPYKKAGEYSGGMKRRLALIRAMLSDGEIIILDEPFTGLDAATRALAEDFIIRHRRGRSLILVSHEEEAGSLSFDRVVDV